MIQWLTPPPTKKIAHKYQISLLNRDEKVSMAAPKLSLYPHAQNVLNIYPKKFSVPFTGQQKQ